jgi:hypothetical protein
VTPDGIATDPSVKAVFDTVKSERMELAYAGGSKVRAESSEAVPVTLRNSVFNLIIFPPLMRFSGLNADPGKFNSITEP